MNVRRQNAGVTEQLIERHELIVNNNDYQTTRRGQSCRSIIDLTLSTHRVGLLTAWEIDEDLATTSDHEVTVFSWLPLCSATTEREGKATPNWNISRLRGDEQTMKAAGEHCDVLSDYRTPISAQATASELDEEFKLASDPDRCWRGLRCTKTQVPSYTPAIQVGGVDGRPDEVVATAEEKEEIFTAQAFPPQASNDGNIVIPNTREKLSADEVHEALSVQSVKKAPGVNGISFKALRLLWRWAEDRIVAPHPRMRQNGLPLLHLEDS